MRVVSEYNLEASIMREPGSPGSVKSNKKLWNMRRKCVKIEN
jgi:hypothetical protein